MEFVVERGQVEDLDIFESRGGKAVDYVARFKLAGSGKAFEFRNMPRCAIDPRDDTLLNGDDIYLVYKKNKKTNDPIIVDGVKNIRSEECLKADAGAVIFSSFGLMTTVVVLCFFAISDGGFNMATALFFGIPFVTLVSIGFLRGNLYRERKRVNAILAGLANGNHAGIVRY